MKNATFFAILSLIATSSFGQDLPTKAIEKQLKGKKVTLLDDGEYIFKIQHKKTRKWGVYQWDDYDQKAKEMLPCAYDSVGWFNDYQPYMVVKNDNMYGLFLNPYEIMDAADRVDCQYDQIKTIEKNGSYFALVAKDNKWGLIDWFDGFTIVPCSYNSSAEVPLLQMESWQLPTMKAARKNLDADLVVFDANNGDGVFKARHRNTLKWGIFQDFGDEIVEMIPMHYDSLKSFPYNGNFTAVYNQGKVGFYLCSWSYEEESKETVPCIYDNYQRFNNEGTIYLAVQKKDHWGWVDWLTGKERSEFNYDSKDDLPNPNYQQKRGFDE